MIVKLWKKGAYIRGSANDLLRQNINERLPKRGAFFYGFFSLFGKAPVCGTGEQGSIPGDTQSVQSYSSIG